MKIPSLGDFWCMQIKLIIYPLVLDSWDWNLNFIQVQQQKSSRIQIMLSPQSRVGLEPVLKACRGSDIARDQASTRGLGLAFPFCGLLHKPHPLHCRAPGRRPQGSLRTSTCTTTHRSLWGSQGHRETFSSMSFCLGLQKATETSLESGHQAQTKGLGQKNQKC